MTDFLRSLSPFELTVAISLLVIGLVALLRRRARKQQMPRITVWEIGSPEGRRIVTPSKPPVVPRPTGSQKPPRNRYPA